MSPPTSLTLPPTTTLLKPTNQPITDPNPSQRTQKRNPQPPLKKQNTFNKLEQQNSKVFTVTNGPKLPSAGSPGNLRVGKSRPFTPLEELSVYALHHPESASLQALGFAKVRAIFPEAETVRNELQATCTIGDPLKRFNALFPANRYGIHRDTKVFEDSSTYFQDLEPLIGLKLRRGETVDLKGHKDNLSEYDGPETVGLLRRNTSFAVR